MIHRKQVMLVLTTVLAMPVCARALHVAAPLENTDRRAIAARLQSLQRLRVEYDLTYQNPAVSEADTKPHMVGGRIIAMVPSNVRQHVVFTFLDGFARWETVAGPEELKWQRNNNIVATPSMTETYDGAIREQMKARGHGTLGAIIPGDRSLRSGVVEVGLGIRVSERGPWITSDTLKAMSYRREGSSGVVLSYSSDTGEKDEWVFDRDMQYAITSYKRWSGTRAIAEVTLTNMTAVEGLTLPRRAVLGYVGKGAAGTRWTADVTKYDVHVHDGGHIRYPINTLLTDTRSGIRYWIRRDNQIVTDALLAQAINSPPNDPNIPIARNLRPVSATAVRERGLISFSSAVACLLGAGFIGVIAVYSVRSYLRRSATRKPARDAADQIDSGDASWRTEK